MRNSFFVGPAKSEGEEFKVIQLEVVGVGLPRELRGRPAQLAELGADPVEPLGVDGQVKVPQPGAAPGATEYRWECTLARKRGERRRKKGSATFNAAHGVFGAG